MRTVKATTLAEVIAATSGRDRDICYRGQPNEAWNLVPSIYRALADAKPDLDQGDTLWIANCERDLYREFQQRGRGLFTLTDRWEIFFLAQHYGVPTRLLDWTKNVSVALFFAVASPDKCDSAVWCLDLQEYPFPEALGRRHRGGGHRLDNIKQYCAGMTPSFLKPVTTKEISPARFCPEGTLVAVEPPGIDQRIERQESIFTFYLSFEDEDLHWDYSAHLAHTERRTAQHVITKIEIPHVAKANIRKQLEQEMRITAYHLFPDLVGLGKGLSEQNQTQFDRELQRRAKPMPSPD